MPAIILYGVALTLRFLRTNPIVIPAKLKENLLSAFFLKAAGLALPRH